MLPRSLHYVTRARSPDMATAVFFHAHPDDESISTAGTMMLAKAAGHRVVLVTATDGALGEPTPGSVPEGSTLAEVRDEELHRAAAVMGVDRVVTFGYPDSGMEGEPTNEVPGCFWQTPVDTAAERLAAILEEEDASVFTIYDDHGNYGHPDHIQVHRVGVRAAELAEVELVYEATMNRDNLRWLTEQQDFLDADDEGLSEEIEARRQQLRESDIGTPAALITHGVDVSSVIDRKKLTMAEHRSQINEESFFMALPSEAFEAAFGTEWFVLRGQSSGGPPYSTDLFAGLES